NIAEPNALIGFSGARVTAGTIAAELPPGFQRSEFLFEHGFLDRVVHRAEMRAELGRLLHFLVPASFDEPGTEPASGPGFRLGSRPAGPERETAPHARAHRDDRG